MAFHVTQCPGCDSTFNTNARILLSAAGKVRCGACLTVFEAMENLVASAELEEDDDTSVFVGNNPNDYFDPTLFITRSALSAFAATADEQATFTTAPDLIETTAADVTTPDEIQELAIPDEQAAEPEPTEPAIFTTAPDLIETTAADISTPNEIQEPPIPEEQTAAPNPAAPEITAELLQPEQIAAAQLRHPAPEDIRMHASFSVYPFQPAPPTPAPQLLIDEAITPEFFETTELVPETIVPEVTTPAATVPAAIVATIVAEPDTATAATAPLAAIEQDYDLIDIDTFEFVEVQLGDGVDAELAEEIAEEFAAEFVAEHAADRAEERVTAAVTEPDDSTANIPPPPVIGNDDSTAAIRAHAFRSTLRDDNALEALPQSTRAAIGRVLPPVELLSGREGRWGRRLLLASAGLLLTALLLAQFLWQRLPIYSRSAQWRPIYEFACGHIACTLPVYNEISAIRSDNLVVRSHPANADALTVSLSFRNTAQFPQPFPILILSFNSATNAIIALREFAPAEYLDAGLQQMELMPVSAPVQIELEVMDPGADAVNYTVAFRRP